MLSFEYFAWFLIAVNVIVFLIPKVKDFGKGVFSSDDYFKSLWWKDNAAIRDGEYYRLVTSMFIHGDVVHLLLNMYSVYVVVPIAVLLFGSVKFFILFFFSGVLGSIFSYRFNPNPSVGASGAVFGVVGSLGLLAFLQGDRESLWAILQTVIVNVIIGFLPGNRIDNWSHLGGFCGGVLITFVLLFV